MAAIVTAICESIPAGVFVVCPFLLSGLTACPIRTQLDHAAARRCKLCRSVSLPTPLRKTASAGFSATRGGPGQSRRLAPARCRACAEGGLRDAQDAAAPPDVCLTLAAPAAEGGRQDAHRAQQCRRTCV